MKKILQPLRWAVPALLLAGFGANAQTLNYGTGGTSNVAGTYTDLAATGTAIATTSTDDANSAAQAIGFTFNFNGTAFTQFVLNTNGLVRLGAVAPSAANLFLSQDQSATQTAVDPITSTNAANTNLLMPFNIDLVSGTSPAEYRVLTTGVAGSRICTVQWKNVSDKTGSGTDTRATQYSNFSFQLKLYEGSNNVEFVYGPAVASTNTAASRFPNVGIKGNNATSAVLANKTTGLAAWSTAVFINGPYTTTTHNFRNETLPDLGRTYRFTPASANDAAVQLIYTQGQLGTFSPAHVVRARVTNVGSAPYTGTATLTVARAGTTLFLNTQPVTALAAGATTTVAFAPYTAAVMANAGTNTVTVSLGNDDNNSDNTRTIDQLVSATTVNYASPAVPTPGGASFGPMGTGNVGARFTIATARQVISIQGYIANGAGTVSGVLFDAAGVELARSAPRTLVAADAGTLITFTLLTPTNIPAGDFYAGLNLGGGASSGSQTEVPTRTGAFYQINTGAAPVDLASNNLGRFNLGAVTGAATSSCFGVTGLNFSNITGTSANVNFTAAASGTSYTVTYTPTGGTATTVTPNPAASPVALTGLTTNTTYTVRVITNCGGGQTSTATVGTFTTALPAPTYATLPFNESFEGPWVNGGGLRNLPSFFWRGTPVSGDSSWRRNDDGVSAGWRNLATGTNGANVPAATTGTFAARFHSFFAPDGSEGQLDLYVNLSGTGTKTMTFDYVNKTGTDGLDVFVSTDGGATFGATPVLSLGVSAAYAPQSVTIASNSATTVIRFVAASDFGDDDISMDNLRIVLVAPPVCNAVTGLTAASANNGTSAVVNFTPSATATNYTVTYQAQPGGTVTSITPNPTASPVTITGLTVNTTYVISVTSNCPNGLTSAPATVPLRTTLAAREALGNGSLAAYPNPAQGAFTLTLPALPGERTATLTLLNSLGQTVQTRALDLNAAGTQTRVDVSSLAKGVYTLRVKTRNQTATKAVVVE